MEEKYKACQFILATFTKSVFNLTDKQKYCIFVTMD